MKHSGVIVQEGFPFIIVSIIITIAAFYLGFAWLAVFLAALTVFIICFFRNPQRKFQDEKNLVISPADGKVIKIDDVELEGSMSGRFKKISIFMNVFNVHVNRAPYNGTIEKIIYHKGKFLSANLDKASAENERNEIMIRTPDGKVVWVVQIAGLIARRIVCWTASGATVAKGERIGMIRFGSRVEVFLPADSSIVVKLDDQVRAGKTHLGYLS
ncbi:MAG TPA: phosphatidylserine decarboxylase family protein [Smithellaceae bacterium]|nr:phosphatidylserine decarboxylase family protein [Smithellaceae bacterium]HPL97037.1 phosphatidylserine decarboxylase family protein [Smithellaceae bacterium]HQF83574.1 phosphatidylserine decarboxylase family protein [Smithellaceae bacterium]HQG79558.1 phosphatidylserine decarboxylase family protein [Smithellaceae bacterium]